MTEVVAWLAVTVQVVLVPVQAPLQPVNTIPVDGVAVSVTVVLAATVSMQSVPPPPQVMPAGLLVTVPLPVEFTSNVGVVKIAVTDCAALMLTVQVVALPPQLPPQLVNTDPVAGVAVKITREVAANASLQSVPQSIPAGELVIVPLPLTVVVRA